MSRIDTIRALVGNFAMEGEALAYPDHPLVLEGPSLLRVTEGVLTASFVYTAGSRPPSSVAEQAQVFLARLAYPGHAVFEAIFEDKSMSDSVAVDLFDSYRVVTARSLSQRYGDDAARTRIRSAVESLRGPHFARFGANQEGVFEGRLGGFRPSFAQFSRGETPSYKFVKTVQDSLTAQLPRGTRARTRNRVQRVAETFTANDYGLGLGVSALVDVAGALQDGSYLDQHAVRMHLTSDDRQTGVELSKPFRAAQFSGGIVKTVW